MSAGRGTRLAGENGGVVRRQIAREIERSDVRNRPWLICRLLEQRHPPSEGSHQEERKEVQGGRPLCMRVYKLPSSGCASACTSGPDISPLVDVLAEVVALFVKVGQLVELSCQFVAAPDEARRRVVAYASRE